LDKYIIKLLPKAYRDLDEIYHYISKELLALETAESMINSIENAIFALEELPYRCSERKVGAYANKGYRQLFVKNYTIIYRIKEDKKFVVIVTVKYTPSSF
jgi:addiction module RelE/StbE family toxin